MGFAVTEADSLPMNEKSLVGSVMENFCGSHYLLHMFVTWRPNMGNLQYFEKEQHYATKWILGSNIKYRNCLLSLGILPLSLYVEMHDLLFLFSMRNVDYDIEETSDKFDSLENTRIASIHGFHPVFNVVRVF